MEFRHLRLVQTLAVEGTLTAAGKKLYLSQSALSHQLREIEDEFGARLFERVKKRMLLTPVGRRVLDTADVVLGEIDSVHTDISRLTSGEVGTLRIAACRNASFYWLPLVLKQFKQRFPGVDVSIDSTSADDPADRLLSGSANLAIVNQKGDRARVAYLKLFDDEMVVVVHAEHPWARKKYVTAKHFANEHLIAYDIPFEEVVFNQKMLMPSGITPKSVTRVPTTDAIIEMVKAGMGVAVMNRWSIRPHLESPDLHSLRLTRKGLDRTWYAAITDDHRNPPFVTHFIGFLALSQG